MQSASMATNSIILLLVLSISCLCSTRDVYIQPSEGEHCPGTPCYNVTTFGKMVNSFSNSSGLVVHFLEGTHLLDLQELVVFTNLTNAVFEGDGRMEQGFHETVWQSTVVIKCTEHSSTGIAFVNSANITFRYITITNCSGDMVDSLTAAWYFASLGYLNVSNIVIDHISVQNGSGCGLLITTDGADLSITSSSFARNGYVMGSSTPTSNVVIVYTDPLNCDPQNYVYNTSITHSNISHVQSSPVGSYGLYMRISQMSYSVTIVLDSVKAYSNGDTNIEILSFSLVPNYNLTINNLHSSDTEGTALKIDTAPALIEHKCCANASTNSIAILIANSKFIYTKSLFVFEFRFQGINDPVTIMIESTEFSDNIFGQNVLYVASYAYQYRVKIVLQNVTLNNNINSNIMLPATINTSQSTVCAEFVTLVLNNVSITNNNATGLYAYRTVIRINNDSTSVFHNNTGTDGGGLAMYGESYLVFEENSLLNFTNNKAKHRGGAIFVNTLNSAKSPCFYQYVQGTSLQSTKAYFIGNSAESAGSVLLEVIRTAYFSIIHVASVLILFR